MISEWRQQISFTLISEILAQILNYLVKFCQFLLKILYFQWTFVFLTKFGCKKSFKKICKILYEKSTSSTIACFFGFVKLANFQSFSMKFAWIDGNLLIDGSFNLLWKTKVIWKTKNYSKFLFEKFLIQFQSFSIQLSFSKHHFYFTIFLC